MRFNSYQGKRCWSNPAGGEILGQCMGSMPTKQSKKCWLLLFYSVIYKYTTNTGDSTS